MTDIVRVILWLATSYATVGVLVAGAFVSAGIARVARAARGAGVGLRLLLLPGAAALWPVVLTKWSRACRGGRTS